jgi:fimbrial chaperone protein
MTLPANPQGARGARCTVPTLLLLLLQLTLPVSALSGEWRVTPIRIDLGKDAKSGAVTVFNESDERLQVQMNAMEWTQDAEGKDQYTDTGDILFFPRIMIFDRRGERILRAGIKLPPGGKEKTYRLFIEEIPEPRQTEGARVAIAIRFGVPIFVKPVKEDLRGEVGNLSMTGGVVAAVARNSGTSTSSSAPSLCRGRTGRARPSSRRNWADGTSWRAPKGRTRRRSRRTSAGRSHGST